MIIRLAPLVLPLILTLRINTPNTEEVPLPLKNAVMTSPYGYRVHPISKVKKFHRGVDLVSSSNPTVRAVGSGLITYAGKYRGYGNLVSILHRNGITSHYAHLSKTVVSVGNTVKSKDAIGIVGSTGVSTGPHLHFEIRKFGRALDPTRVIPALKNLIGRKGRHD